MSDHKWLTIIMLGIFGVFALASLAYMIAIIWAIVKVTLHFT